LKMPNLKFLRVGWHLVTDVPGWPDAPRSIRLRRAMPILLPCIGLVVLLGWKMAVLEPQMRSGQLNHQPVIALLEEIEALRLECSDQQAADLSAHATTVAKLALADPGEMNGVLQRLEQEALAKGWAATLQSSESTDEVPKPDADLAFLQARGRLSPLNGEKSSFSTLLALLDQFSINEKRIDLTRLAVRADEQGRHAVEVNFRLARLVPHEKTAQ
jgi:hypothetical protein